MTSRFSAAILSAVFLSVFSTVSLAQKDTGKDLRHAVERVDKASEAVTEIMAIKESIPRDLLAKTQAVVVFPGAIKGAFIVGAQEAKGVAIRRVGSSWSAPAFLNMGGGSVGLQIGGSKTDYVLLIMNDKGLQKLLGDGTIKVEDDNTVEIGEERVDLRDRGRVREVIESLVGKTAEQGRTG